MWTKIFSVSKDLAKVQGKLKNPGFLAKAPADVIEKEDDTHCEVIDLRSLVPLDTETVLDSVRRTGRVVVVHEAPRNCGFGAELIAVITEKVFLHLQAPPLRVTGFATPFPYTLEHEYLPDVGRIREAVQTVMNY